jgi:hypothetical protein
MDILRFPEGCHGCGAVDIMTYDIEQTGIDLCWKCCDEYNKWRGKYSQTSPNVKRFLVDMQETLIQRREQREEIDICRACGESGHFANTNVEDTGLTLCDLKCAVDYQVNWRLEHARVNPDVRRYVNYQRATQKRR